MIGIEDVQCAARRLDGVVHRTPVLTSSSLDGVVRTRVSLKPEVLQRTGSFKLRGAYNKIASFSDSDRERGVLAFSSGNHAHAVALAARLFDTRATIVMPADAPEFKLAAARRHGAEVVTYDRFSEDRERIVQRIIDDRSLSIVPPFDDPDVMAGQGTVALELVQDAGHLDLLIAPVSGGGLIAGCAVAVKSLCPNARVIGVEPELADDYRRSLAAGRRVAIEPPRTIADALRARTPGELTFAINRDLLDEIVTVSDANLIEAMAFAFEHLKLVLEPGGAAALAALLRHKVSLGTTTHVGIILSGGNIDPAHFAALVTGRDS
jgi:threonine dehydratase